MFVKKRAQDRLERELPSHMQSIWRYGVSLSGRKDVADDLLQATCLRALEKADQFRMGTSMIAWLLTICRSIWLNELRSAAVRKTDALEPEALDQIAAENLGQDANIFARQVFSEMMALPEAQRA